MKNYKFPFHNSLFSNAGLKELPVEFGKLKKLFMLNAKEVTLNDSVLQSCIKKLGKLRKKFLLLLVFECIFS